MSKCNCGCSSAPAPQLSKVQHRGIISKMEDGLYFVDLNVNQSDCKCCSLSSACSRGNQNIVKIKENDGFDLAVGDEVVVEMKATPWYAFIVRHKTILRYALVILLSVLAYLLTRDEEITCVVLVIAMTLNFIINPRIRMDSNCVWKIVKKL